MSTLLSDRTVTSRRRRCYNSSVPNSDVRHTERDDACGDEVQHSQQEVDMTTVGKLSVSNCALSEIVGPVISEMPTGPVRGLPYSPCVACGFAPYRLDKAPKTYISPAAGVSLKFSRTIRGRISKRYSAVAESTATRRQKHSTWGRY